MKKRSCANAVQECFLTFIMKGEPFFSTVRRLKRFAQQCLGAGAIHSPRASAIAEG